MLNSSRPPRATSAWSAGNGSSLSASARAWPMAVAALLVWGLFSVAAMFSHAHAAGPGRAITHPETRLLDGRVLGAGDLKGKVVLVQFWATWCPACVEEMPDLQKLRAKYHKQGFELLALSLDDNDKLVRSFMKANGYDFPVALATRSHFETYGPAHWAPTFYLVDKHGLVLQKVVGSLDYGKLEKVLQSLL